VIERAWLHKPDHRLHSVFVEEYVWNPDEPAAGDVGTHGIYSFRHVIRCNKDYGSLTTGTLLFSKVKIWGEIVEHESATNVMSLLWARGTAKYIRFIGRQIPWELKSVV
jgi:hypothetical protein